MIKYVNMHSSYLHIFEITALLKPHVRKKQQYIVNHVLILFILLTQCCICQVPPSAQRSISVRTFKENIKMFRTGIRRRNKNAKHTCVKHNSDKHCSYVIFPIRLMLIRF